MPWYPDSTVNVKATNILRKGNLCTFVFVQLYYKDYVNLKNVFSKLGRKNVLFE